MKGVLYFDWKLGANRPISWVMTHAGNGGRTPDIHQAIHLGLVLAGSQVSRYGNTEVILRKNDVFLTAPWEPHCTVSCSSTRKILLINLDKSMLEGFFFAGWEKLEQLFLMNPLARMRYLNQAAGKTTLLKKAVRICRHADSAEDQLELYNAVLAFLISLLPRIESGEALPKRVPVNRMRPALQGLSCQLTSVGHAAGLCNLSSSRFAFLFKSAYGMSFARYERLFRLNGAKDDLRRGSTLKEAAEKWSFCDKSHLARLLKVNQ